MQPKERPDMDKIFIRDLLARGIIGINPDERESAQDILINITVFTDTRRAAQTDDLEYSVNYSSLARKVKSHAERAARFTVEALAQDLADICLQEDGVKKVIVRVEKPEAVKSTRSVGIEIERERD
jgi:FolB domain-containing protein